MRNYTQNYQKSLESVSSDLFAISSNMKYLLLNPKEIQSTFNSSFDVVFFLSILKENSIKIHELTSVLNQLVSSDDFVDTSSPVEQISSSSFIDPMIQDSKDITEYFYDCLYEVCERSDYNVNEDSFHFFKLLQLSPVNSLLVKKVIKFSFVNFDKYKIKTVKNFIKNFQLLHTDFKSSK